VLRQLIASNLVRVNAEAVNTLQRMPDARSVLKGQASMLLRQQASDGNPERSQRGSKSPVKTDD